MTIEDLIDRIMGCEGVEAAGGRSRFNLSDYATVRNLRLLAAYAERLRGRNGYLCDTILCDNRVTSITEKDAE